MGFGICRGPGTNLSWILRDNSIKHPQMAAFLWRPKGMGDHLENTLTSLSSPFSILHTHSQISFLIPSAPAIIPTFSQQLPRTNRIQSLMPGRRGTEQKSSLLGFWPLTPVVTLSTLPLLPAPSGTASSLSSPLITPSPSSFKHPAHYWPPHPHLLIHSLVSLLQPYFELTRPPNPQCTCTHIYHTKSHSINSLLPQLRAHKHLRSLISLPLLNSPDKTPTLIKPKYLPIWCLHIRTR